MKEEGKLAGIFPTLCETDLPLEELDLEVAVGNALRRRGVHTLAQLLQMSRTELLESFPNRQLRSYEDVIHRLVCLSEETGVFAPGVQHVEDVIDEMGGNQDVR